MIREFEKKILTKMDFANKFLQQARTFVSSGQDVSTFKKNEILNLFVELGLPCKYEPGGWFEIEKKYENYTFRLGFQIRHNSPLMHPYIFKNGQRIENGLAHFSYLLNLLPYDENLLPKNFGLNSVEELKRYIFRMIQLFEEFVELYIKEIKLGNNPEADKSAR